MSARTWRGPLKPLRKNDLQSILDDMGIPFSASAKKSDHETSIRNALNTNVQLQNDPRFSGLWASMADSSRRSSDSGSSSSPPAAQKPASSSRSLEQTPRRRSIIPATAQTFTPASVAKSAKEAAANIEASFVRLADESKSSALVCATNTQLRLSSTWTVIALSILIEFVFVITSSIPFTGTLRVGPFTWVTGPIFPKEPWELSTPDFLALLKYSWLRPFFIWIATSIILPLIVAQFVVVRQSATKSTRSAKLDPPSPLTFSIIRLALNVYNAKINLGADRIIGSSLLSLTWTWDIFNRFGDIQIICSAAALAFAFAYELHRA